MLTTLNQTFIGQLVRKLLNRDIVYIVIIIIYGRKYIDWQYLNMRSICRSWNVHPQNENWYIFIMYKKNVHNMRFYKKQFQLIQVKKINHTTILLKFYVAKFIIYFVLSQKNLN